MTPVLYLPSKLEKNLKQLTEQTREITGFLFYTKLEDNMYWVNPTIFLTGIGSGGSVSPTESDEFGLITNFIGYHLRDINPIEFHTHHKGLGPEWWNRFSEPDIQNIKSIIYGDGNHRPLPDYIGMLVTPEKLMARGIKHPGLTSIPIMTYTKLSEPEENWINKMINMNNEINTLKNLYNPHLVINPRD